MHQPDIDAMIDPALMAPIDPMFGVQYQNPVMPITDVNAISTPPQRLSAQNSFTVSNGSVQPVIDPNLDPALMSQSVIDPSLDQAAIVSDRQPDLPPLAIPQLRTAAVSTPDMDKSFSPITAEFNELTSKHDSEEEQSHPAQIAADNLEPVAETTLPQVNGVVPAAPAPISQVKHEPDIQRRRLSTTVSDSSPKPEATSPSTPRSSSHTSGTIHQTAVVQAPVDANVVAVNHTPNKNSSPRVKQETITPARDFTRAVTAASDTSEPEDTSERLARELQAQEHGLRRRPSVRIS